MLKLNKASCVWSIRKFVVLFEKPIHEIMCGIWHCQMDAASSLYGMHPRGRIFCDSGAYIRLNLSDGTDYVDFEGTGRLQLLGIDLRFITRSRALVNVASAWNNHVLISVVQNVHCGISCVTRNVARLEPHVVHHTHIVQFGPKDICYYWSVADSPCYSRFWRSMDRLCLRPTDCSLNRSTGI